MARPQRRNFFLRHPSVLALGLVLALVMGKIPITHGGFYCDDASIGFKRTPHETFDTNLLIAICILPLMAVVRNITFIKNTIVQFCFVILVSSWRIPLPGKVSFFRVV
jgi:hypothetical protein